MNILIADDEENIRKLLTLVIEEMGHRAVPARNGGEALARYPHDIDLILLDIRMPEADGLQVLARIKDTHPTLPVILMTAYGDVNTAVRALKAGAFDYIVKPFDLDDIRTLINNALETPPPPGDYEKIALRDEDGEPREILTRSPKMMELCRDIAKISQTDASVLINGESGAGKELVAKAIYYHSPRADAPFIKVNCGALPESLLESTLFGHEKGAFTGAQQRRPGLFERADRGTLFLDEVGEMSPNLQVRLLRVLQEKEFEPLGASKSIKTDFRLIAATNRSLQELVDENRFRLDLYYRLNVMSLHLPPLRERREDIALLSRHFLRRFARKHGKSAREIAEDTLALLESYDWPGNVRELSNAIEHAVILAGGSHITPADLPPDLRTKSPPADNTDNGGKTLRENMKIHEKRLIREALQQHRGNREQTAKTLGISKRALIYKIREYDL